MDHCIEPDLQAPLEPYRFTLRCLRTHVKVPVDDTNEYNETILRMHQNLLYDGSAKCSAQAARDVRSMVQLCLALPIKLLMTHVKTTNSFRYRLAWPPKLSTLLLRNDCSHNCAQRAVNDLMGKFSASLTVFFSVLCVIGFGAGFRISDTRKLPPS